MQRRMQGSEERVKEWSVDVRRGWGREPWSEWSVRVGFEGEARREAGATVGGSGFSVFRLVSGDSDGVEARWVPGILCALLLLVF